LQIRCVFYPGLDTLSVCCARADHTVLRMYEPSSVANADSDAGFFKT